MLNGGLLMGGLDLDSRRVAAIPSISIIFILSFTPIVVPFAPKVYADSDGRTSVRFNTLSSLIFTEFHALFYSNGVQIVPPTIGHPLTARGLAYWSMD